MSTSREHFPYVFSELPDLRAFEKIRPEGTDPSQYWYQFWRGLTYLKKYHSKRHRVSPSMAEHFEAQRRLLTTLAHEPQSGPRLGAFGDLMWIRDQWRAFLSPESRRALERYDALIGNLETVVAPDVPVTSWLPDLVRYNSPREYLETFSRDDGKSMLSALSTANNHTLDFGDTGALATLEVLDALDIPHSGVRAHTDERRWTEFDVGGVRVGFVAATFGVNYPADLAASNIALYRIPGLAPEGETPPELDALRSDLRAMEEAGTEFRVVSMHWGFEYESHPSPGMMRTAREIAAAGADLVMGHHPHLQHPLEVLFVNQDPPKGPDQEYLRATSRLSTADGRQRRALIAYSLGNFTTCMVTDACKLGVVLSVCLDRGPDGVTWNAPRAEWFYNACGFFKRGPGARSLLPLAALVEREDQDRWQSLARAAKAHFGGI